jgi:AhpD family alkylhydroperoxidase
MNDQQDPKKPPGHGDACPEAAGVFGGFDETAFEDGAIPVKYKELMGLAVALASECPYCTRVRFQKARGAGATERELAEAAAVAAAVRRGASVKHRWARPQ